MMSRWNKTATRQASSNGDDTTKLEKIMITRSGAWYGALLSESQPLGITIDHSLEIGQELDDSSASTEEEALKEEG